jgi:SAM-dependent methyltransferase
MSDATIPGRGICGRSRLPLAPRPDHALADPRFPRSSRYDPAWVFENQMGPNVLWLTEWLAGAMALEPGMRVLDMGAGRAISSIFLAAEYGVEVWANDLWIGATDNWGRVRAAGMEGKVHPVHAEAHDLPYAEGFFDAILSMDSYQYYGTDDLYLRRFSAFARPGARIGIVVPGLHRDFDGPVPEHLARKQKSGGVFWEPDCWCFHTAAWWRSLWARYPFVELEACEAMLDGGGLWQRWERALLASGVKKMFPSDLECLEEDAERYLTFIRVVARRAPA